MFPSTLPCSTSTQTQEAPFKALSFSCWVQHKEPPAVKTGVTAKNVTAVIQRAGVTFIFYQRVIRGRYRRTHPEKTAHIYTHTLFLHTALCCSLLSKWSSERSHWFTWLWDTSNAWHYLHRAACFKWYIQTNQSPCCWNPNNVVHTCGKHWKDDGKQAKIHEKLEGCSCLTHNILTRLLRHCSVLMSGWKGLLASVHTAKGVCLKCVFLQAHAEAAYLCWADGRRGCIWPPVSQPAVRL